MKAIRFFTLLFLLILFGVHSSFGQEKPAEKAQPLSGVNWDDEVSNPVEKTESLSGVDWDEEEESETDKLQKTGPGETNWDDEESEESEFPEETELPQNVPAKTLFSHWQGGLLFLFYLSGCFVTAYFTRNRAISLKTPPELLIILHTFWPLELLLTPFFKK
ncbi:MAG: hypothetical protein GY786_24825 [Proteobacteria bacterium]|nr:hypothetical protein [Pseudomonadota bacterium]